MPSYERYETRRRQYGSASSRTTWGYWVPLVVTVGVATAGLAAWIWSERKDDDDDDHDYPPPRPYTDRPPGPPPGGYPGPPAGPGYDATAESTSAQYSQSVSDIPPFERSQGQHTESSEQRNTADEGIVSRMSGALRRTPSPQQIFDVASKRVTAGVAAAGAAVGGALASISEEGKGDYEDHSRWSEEADSQNGSSKKGPKLRDAETAAVDLQTGAQTADTSGHRSNRTVALVISAEHDHEYEEGASYHQEHASILSHLPDHVDQGARVYILIYDPFYKESSTSTVDRPNQSMTSSYSNIAHEDAQSTGQSSPQRSQAFQKLYSQAENIVEKDAMIMPFTSISSSIQMLRQISPEVVYIQTSLAGSRGEQLDLLSSSVGQVVLVVGDEGGHGGLVDSEDERGEDSQDKWWLQDSRIGLGKGIEVVEGLRIGEDWARRIKGHD